MRRKATVSMEDIAEELDTSIATVSNALNNKAGMSAELRLKVFRTAERLGYDAYRKYSIVNAYDRKLKFVVVLYGQIGGHLVEEMQLAIDNKIHREGLFQLRYLFNAGDESRSETAKELFLKRLEQENGIVGFLSCYMKMPDSFIKKFQKSGIPVVMLENRSDFCSSVSIDNVDAAYKATSALLRLGKRRIGCIMPQEDLDHVWRDRMTGYKKALKENGVSYDPDYVYVENTVTISEGETATEYMLKKHPGMDGMLYGGDYQAYGGIKALRKGGLRIPEDVAVIGFDDMKMNNVILPSLSSVRQPIFEMAETGLKLLLDSMRKRACRRVSKLLKAQLILRDSCPKTDKKRGGGR